MLIDIAVALAIFILGIALTVRRFGGPDYPALMLGAVLTPALAIIAVFCVFYLAFRRKTLMDPCPDGLEEAEKIVEIRRQQMFGGQLRPPSITASWRRAYQLQLQMETQRVQSFARRYLVIQ
jgi:hypothetical protein